MTIRNRADGLVEYRPARAAHPRRQAPRRRDRNHRRVRPVRLRGNPPRGGRRNRRLLPRRRARPRGEGRRPRTRAAPRAGARGAALVFDRPTSEVCSGSKPEILAKSTCFPLYPRKRTQVGHRAMSEKCQYATSTVTPSPIPTHRLSGIPDFEGQQDVAGQTAPLSVA